MSNAAPASIPQLPNGGYILPTDRLAISRSGTTYCVFPTPSNVPGQASNIISAGQAVSVKSDGTYQLAVANDANKYRAIGFALSNYTVGDVVYFSNGSVTLTGPLTPGAIYYLSDSSLGGITATKPTATGSYVVQVGVATSTTTLHINFGTYPTAPL